MKNKKTVLITGANGFLGSFVVKIFLSNNYTVVALGREHADLSRLEDVKKNQHLFFYTIDKLGEVFADHNIDFIAHTATCYGRNDESFSEIIEANIVLPIRLLELAVKYNVPCFINVDTFFNEDMGLKPGEKCYVLTKKTFLQAAKMMAAPTLVKFVNLRIQQMYGPADNLKKFVPGMAVQLIGNNKISLTAGDQKRDFIFVEDVARAFLSVAENCAKINGFEEFGIGSGKSVSIKNMVEIMKEITGSASVLGWGEMLGRENEIMDSAADLSNNKKINWTAGVALEEGLKKTIQYYKNR